MKLMILTLALALSSVSMANMGSDLVGQEIGVSEEFGGVGAEVRVLTDHSASITFDCASGNVEAGRWPTGQSRIAAAGTYTSAMGGMRPMPGQDMRRTVKAAYKANIDMSTGKMTLSVKVGTARAQIYKLVKGQQPVLRRCM